MPEENIFKVAFARGIAEQLQNMGHVQFPSGESMKEAAKQASKNLKNNPVEGNYTAEEVEKTASHILHCNQQLDARGKTASDPSSVSISTDMYTAVGDMVQKLAKEVNNKPGTESSTIKGDDPTQENTLQNASEHSGEGKMEEGKRPEGYALVGEGGANFDTPQSARVGKEQKHPRSPEDGKGPQNSVEDASTPGQESKAASILENLQKLSADEKNTPESGSATITGDDPSQENTLSETAQNSGEGKMEQVKRPEGYANVGQGNANFSESQDARVGKEQSHPRQPNDGDGKSNSVEQASKTSQWNALFKKTAQEVAPHLPNNMPEEEKIAAIKQCMAAGPGSENQVIKQAQQKYANVGNTLSGLL